jgi:prephenate dehydrogenase
VTGVTKLALLGVGLIGGSLAAALKRAGTVEEISAWAPGEDAATALSLGLVDSAPASLEEAVDGAAFVVLAAPVPAMPALFARLRPALAPDAVVTDCGSTKRSVVEAARRMLGDAFARFVPGHPIAGSERSGPRAADANLFRQRRWLLCPVEETRREACEAVRRLLEPTGARVEAIDPLLHDRLFAEVSHWPHAVAFALSAAIADGSLAEEAITYSGAGLRDTTRIGASAPQLWAGIMLDNRDACLDSAARFRERLQEIEAALERGDREALIEVFAQASRWRERIG